MGDYARLREKERVLNVAQYLIYDMTGEIWLNKALEFGRLLTSWIFVFL